MSSILTAVSVQVVERWKEDAALLAALGEARIYSRMWPPDIPKPATRFKYITVGDKTETDVAVMGIGRSMTLTAHAWSKGYYDDAPVEELLALMDAALEAAPLVVAGYGNVVLRNDGLRAVTGDPDLEYRHGIVRYRISTLKV